jgi:predicted nucleic acid-binding protein
MIFPDIPAGSAAFLDVNVLVYYFVPDPEFGPACRDLLDRISLGEITGFTSSDVLGDVAHRLMTYEAADKYGWPMQGIAYRLQRHPAELQALTRFRQAVEAIPGFGVQVLPVAMAHVLAAAALSQQHGLLSGDALVAAVMHERGLSHLASHDTDFDRVPTLTRYAPL